MPIRQVQFYPGGFYHIFNRGNGKQDIFRNDKDRYRFLQAAYLSNNSNGSMNLSQLEKSSKGYTLLEIKNLLRDEKITHEPLVRIIADCLMPNHFHFFAEEIQENGVVTFMQRLGTSYGRYFATKYKRPGSLFQGRFKAVHIKDNDQLMYLLAYINVLNPAQLVEPDLKEKGIENMEKVWEWVDNYSWGTHQEYMNKRDSIIIDKGLLGELLPSVELYRAFVEDVLNSKKRNIWEALDGFTID